MRPAFHSDTRGSLSIEFALIAPLLITMLLLGFSAFDAYRSWSRAGKTTAAISDIISRQSTITPQFVTDLHGLIDGMLPWLREEKSLRVTALANNGTGGIKVVWSFASGQITPRTTAGIDKSLRDILPAIPAGGSILLTETRIPHHSILSWSGFDDLVWELREINLPRFVPCIADPDNNCAKL